ncbi:TPA: hypothetical protein NGW16_004196 [Vibrio parahaemolyticus]|nr:hypothetical protein [Vibrio parahaemolyticus]
MIFKKHKSRKAKLNRLKLKHFIEIIYESNSFKTQNLISLSETRFNSRLVSEVFIELGYTTKIRNKSTNNMYIHHLPKELEEIIYNEFFKHDEFRKFIINSTN